MTWTGSPPDHWTARCGIIAMKYAASPSTYAGAFQPFGDSTQEQRPELPANLPYSGFPATRKYPANSVMLNCGLMGIGIVDLYTAVRQLVPATAPGRWSLLCGINDALISLGNNNQTFLTSFHDAVINIVNLLVVAGNGVEYGLMQSIPYAVDGSHDYGLVDEFNQILSAVAANYGIAFFDVRPRWFNNRTPKPGALSSDGVHYGPAAIMDRANVEQCFFTGTPIQSPSF